MCRTTGYKSTTCGHRWLTITTRCAPNMGFTNTPIHEFRADGFSLFGTPKYQKAAAGTCPNCDLKGQYDGNTTRMVLGCGGREIRRRIQRSDCGGYAPPVYISGPATLNYPHVGATGTGQVLSPYQQQFAATRQLAAMARWQYCPMEEQFRLTSSGKSNCNIM